MRCILDLQEAKMTLRDTKTTFRFALLLTISVTLLFGYWFWNNRMEARSLGAVESGNLDTIVDSWYFVAITLTTVGFGDIYPLMKSQQISKEAWQLAHADFTLWMVLLILGAGCLSATISSASTLLNAAAAAKSLEEQFAEEDSKCEFVIYLWFICIRLTHFLSTQ